MERKAVCTVIRTSGSSGVIVDGVVNREIRRLQAENDQLREELRRARLQLRGKDIKIDELKQTIVDQLSVMVEQPVGWGSIVRSLIREFSMWLYSAVGCDILEEWLKARGMYAE